MRVVAVVLLLLALGGCAAPASPDAPRKLDDHPLWTMRYAGGYDRMKATATPPPATPYGCSLFAASGLFARNFDWDHNPAMLLFTEPPDGYASVSMVDLSYLGVTDPAAQGEKLADAPLLPFDGMNAKGLAIGLAAVPSARAGSSPGRPTVSGVRIIRLVLDKAATVEEAVTVFRENNVDFSGGPPLHYLVADATGKSVVIEFVDGKVVAQPARTAVNFTLAGSSETTRQADTRYHTATDGLPGVEDWHGAMDLLGRVVQGHTQWSVVYDLETGEIHLATDKDFTNVHTFRLPR